MRAGLVPPVAAKLPAEMDSPNPWSRYIDDAFETILIAWLAFAFLPEKPTRSQGGTDGSNPLSSTGESAE